MNLCNSEGLNKMSYSKLRLKFFFSYQIGFKLSIIVFKIIHRGRWGKTVPLSQLLHFVTFNTSNHFTPLLSRIIQGHFDEIKKQKLFFWFCKVVFYVKNVFFSLDNYIYLYITLGNFSKAINHPPTLTKKKKKN